MRFFAHGSTVKLKLEEMRKKDPSTSWMDAAHAVVEDLAVIISKILFSGEIHPEWDLNRVMINNGNNWWLYLDDANEGQLSLRLSYRYSEIYDPVEACVVMLLLWREPRLHSINEDLRREMKAGISAAISALH